MGMKTDKATLSGLKPTPERQSYRCQTHMFLVPLGYWIREITWRANGGCTDLIGRPSCHSQPKAFYGLPVLDIKGHD